MNAHSTLRAHAALLRPILLALMLGATSACGVLDTQPGEQDRCLAYPDCGPDATKVDRCDTSQDDCFTASICGTTIYCEKYPTGCAAVPTCQEGWDEVPACPNDGSMCEQVTECGATITCAKRPPETCTAVPTCPAGSSQVPAGSTRCEEDLLPGCTPVTMCGQTIQCAPDLGCMVHEAASDGLCDHSFGVAFNGESCQAITGCKCVGSGCESLFPTEADCEQATMGCFQEKGLCEDRSDARFISSPASEVCNGIPQHRYLFDGARCVERTAYCGNVCVGADCKHLYDDAASCLSATAQCGAPSCAAMDAVGDEQCDADLGVVFDGTKCVWLSGCSCHGDDCADMYHDKSACEAAHTSCAP